MNKQDIETAQQILGRLYEGRNRDATQSSLGLRLSKSPSYESPPTVTRQKLKLPQRRRRGPVDPKAETRPVASPETVMTSPSRTKAAMAKAETHPVDYENQTRKDARAAGSLIRNVSKDQNAPAWKRDLVKKDFELHGTPVYAAPEQWHSKPMGDPSVKGRLRVTAKDPAQRKDQWKEVSGTIANAAGRASYTCTNDSGQTYTSTRKCPPKHKQLSTTQPSRTQAAMGRVIDRFRRPVGESEGETWKRLYTDYDEDPPEHDDARYDEPFDRTVRRKRRERDGPGFEPPTGWSPEADNVKKGDLHLGRTSDERDKKFRNIARARGAWIRAERLKHLGQAVGPDYKKREAEMQRRRAELGKKLDQEDGW